MAGLFQLEAHEAGPMLSEIKNNCYVSHDLHHFYVMVYTGNTILYILIFRLKQLR